MNALAHYCTMLVHLSKAEEKDTETARLEAEARDLYSRLQTVDADRKGRYIDMGESLLVSRIARDR